MCYEPSQITYKTLARVSRRFRRRWNASNAPLFINIVNDASFAHCTIPVPLVLKE
jgi:hypothetical protein